MTKLPIPSWPSYFQPLVGQEAISEDPKPRFPVYLLDIFLLRHPASRYTQRVVVTACLGGQIAVYTDSNIEQLPRDIYTVLITDAVNRRNRYRMITAPMLFVTTLDAVTQDVQAPGLNDPVHLYGTMQASIVSQSCDPLITVLNTQGHITARRIDLLAACSLGAQFVFQGMQDEGHISHLMVPTAPIEQIEQGYGAALVYPFLDPATIEGADNRFIIMRIAYDLLARLQYDMVQEQLAHPFAQLVLPVPSRHRLETELEADGYLIQGDSAIQQKAVPAQAQSMSLLGRLRRLADRWSASRIELPKQATFNDYRKIMQELLPTLAGGEDRRMLEALTRLIETHIVYQGSSDKPSALSPGKPPSPQAKQKQTSSQPSQSQNPRKADTWADDFGAAEPTPAVQPIRNTDWWRTEVESMLTATVETTSTKDWVDDFAAEHQSSQPRTKKEPSPAHDWSDDFGSSESDGSTSGPSTDRSGEKAWSSDFDTNT